MDGRSTGSDAMPGHHFGLLEMKRAAGAGNGKGGERGGPADGVSFRWAASRAAAAAGTPSVQPGGPHTVFATMPSPPAVPVVVDRAEASQTATMALVVRHQHPVDPTGSVCDRSHHARAEYGRAAALHRD